MKTLVLLCLLALVAPAWADDDNEDDNDNADTASVLVPVPAYRAPQGWDYANGPAPRGAFGGPVLTCITSTVGGTSVTTCY